MRQALELWGSLRYHLGFEFQGKPVRSAGGSNRAFGWRSGVGALLVAGAAVVAALGPTAPARGPTDAVVALSELPAEAQSTHALIRAGGPFPYSKDGSVFGNRERLLPDRERGFYREYTVPTPQSRDRGARRIVCGGRVPVAPASCYYTDDHYASFRLIAQ